VAANHLVNKHERIADRLRRDIVAGVWKPGARLPTRVALIERFAVSAPTLQRALDALREDDFIESRGRRGTFVAENPPHLRRIGIGFPIERALPWRGRWSGMWHAIETVMAAPQAYAPWRFAKYYGLADPQSRGARQFADDRRRCRLAAVLDLGSSLQLVPRDCMPVDGAAPAKGSGAPIVMSRYDEQLARWAVRSGVRRIGVIASSLRTDSEVHWRQTLASHGLSFSPWLFASIHPDQVDEARRIALLLAGQQANRRPQWLVIEDDHLVEPVTMGVRESALRIPDQMQLIAHCNFPTPPPAQLQTLRVGYDMRQLIQRAIEAVSSGEVGRTSPVMIDPVFDQRLQALPATAHE